jgi:serine protease Do
MGVTHARKMLLARTIFERLAEEPLQTTAPFAAGRNYIMDMSMHRWGLFALVGGLALVQAPLAAREVTESSPALDVARQLNQAFIEVADKVSPSVVVIRVAHKPDYAGMDEESNPFFDMVPELRQHMDEQFKKRRQHQTNRGPIYDGQGSGIVISEDGYILTNRHVVDGADKILVRLKDGTEFEVTEVKGDSQSDVAVLKINAKGLTVAKLGDSSQTRVGEFAIAIGAPFELDYSVTFGHVSAKGRRGLISTGAMWDQDFVQTDASINPGNSGGPLVNIEGEVIGINTLIRGMRTGIGFAIPSNLAKEVADQLITDGKYTRAVLGVAITSLSDAKEYKKLVRSVTEGVVVKQIFPWAPAADSDLEAGDIIVTVDGKPVATDKQLQNEIRRKKIGQQVTLEVVRIDAERAEKRLKIQVKPGELPETTFTATQTKKPIEETASKGLGIKVQALTKELAEKLNVGVKQGVLVSQVESDSLAEDAGVVPGDIITQINRQKISSPKEFKDALKTADTKKGVILNWVNDTGRRIELLKDSGD